MTTLAVAPFRLVDTRIAGLFGDIHRGSPALSSNALLLLAGFAICLLLPLVDERLFNGINVWHKPAKFFLSLSVQLATVAWALSLLDTSIRTRRRVRWSVIAMIVAAWLEIVYIVFRAARAEGSHYNVDQPLEALAYSLMGLGAVTLTATAAIIGFVLLLNRRGDLWKEAAGLGLVIGNILATVVAIPLSAGGSHWIGGDQTDATGLPLFFWSTTGGDLRVAHFLALHIAQTVPFATLSGQRAIIYCVTALMVVATIVSFWAAFNAIPLFRM